MIKLIICDLDGTLFNNEHRAEFIPTDKSHSDNWRRFNERLIYDTPIRYRIQILTLFAMIPGTDIVYLTGRSDEYHAVTKAILSMNHAPIGSLYMRDRNDHRTAADVKVDLIRDIVGSGVRFALFDDDLSVCHAVANYFPLANIIKFPSHDCAYLSHSRNLELCQ